MLLRLHQSQQPWQLAQQPVRLQWSPLLKERAVSLPLNESVNVFFSEELGNKWLGDLALATPGLRLGPPKVIFNCTCVFIYQHLIPKVQERT